MRKIITCIGIRPDIIRLSLIIEKFDLYFENIIVDNLLILSDNSLNDMNQPSWVKKCEKVRKEKNYSTSSLSSLVYCSGVIPCNNAL
ncbi:hypothetical protein LCGC14_1864520 [marine sediment metagenome]|uniref:Uncharacterized protein n=1 Tax=marine sediment metagenome TaxID=412755 RepID=A0A0F9G6V3_9ZZZZ